MCVCLYSYRTMCICLYSYRTMCVCLYSYRTTCMHLQFTQLAYCVYIYTAGIPYVYVCTTGVPNMYVYIDGVQYLYAYTTGVPYMYVYTPAGVPCVCLNSWRTICVYLQFTQLAYRMYVFTSYTADVPYVCIYNLYSWRITTARKEESFTSTVTTPSGSTTLDHVQTSRPSSLEESAQRCQENH